MPVDPHRVWDGRVTSRISFFNFFRRWGVNVRPRYLKNFSPTKSLFASRNKAMAIREAALRKVKVRFSYKRLKDGAVKVYLVEPYSWRFRRTRLRPRTKVLYAYHSKEKQIKMFVLERIYNVYVTGFSYKPKWRVEIR